MHDYEVWRPTQTEIDAPGLDGWKDANGVERVGIFRLLYMDGKFKGMTRIDDLSSHPVAKPLTLSDFMNSRDNQLDDQLMRGPVYWLTLSIISMEWIQ